MAAEFANQVVVVTGANGNVGQAVARRFASAGAKLVLVGRSESELAAIAQETSGLIAVADVTDPTSVEAMVSRVEAELGSIHVLAHTVGGYNAGVAVHEGGLDILDKMLALNTRSVYVTCGRVAKHMVERQVKGRIVAVLARSAYAGASHHAAYSASKAAAQRIIQSMALELASNGITVNAVMPSTIDTPPNRSAMPKADYSKWVTPDQLADAIAFLSSPVSSALNGLSLDVFGQV